MTPTSETKLNAVIGHPLHHSLSPLLHTSVYELLDIDAVMLAFPGQDLSSLVQSIRSLPIHLTAVTIPYKEKILPYLDLVDEEAREIGSVNTVLNDNGRLRGANTDVVGIQNAFNGVALQNKKILIVGAGGAAKAASWVMKKNGASLSYYNRTKEKVQRLQDAFGGTIVAKDEMEHGTFDIIINTTPVGMYPHDEETPLEKFGFLPHQIVFDSVYNPKETRLLREARRAGAKTISGIDMFTQQAFAQIHLWTGKEISEEIKKKLRSLV